MKDFSASHYDEVTSAAQGWKDYVRAIDFHDLTNFVQSVKKDVVNLFCNHDCFLRVELYSQNEVFELLLGLIDARLCLTSYEYFICCSSVRARWNISKYSRERRRKIDCRLGRGFDEFYVLTRAARNQGMHRKLQSNDINLMLQLHLASAYGLDFSIEDTNHLINHHENPSLSMFYTLHVAKDVDTISLIETTINTVAVGGASGVWISAPRLEEKYVCPGVVGAQVNVAQHARAYSSRCAIKDEIWVDVNDGRPLLVVRKTRVD